MKLKKAFTLIELLVVVAIILIISSIIFVSFENAQKKSRDAKRKSDLTTIQTALEMYYRENGYYPYPTTETSDYNRFTPSTQLGSYLSSYPQDPKNSTNGINEGSGGWMGAKFYQYSYVVSLNHQKYLLWANLETSTGNGEDYSSATAIGPYNLNISSLLELCNGAVANTADKIYVVEKH